MDTKNFANSARLWSPSARKQQVDRRIDEIEAIRARHGGSLKGAGGGDADRARQLTEELRVIGENTPAGTMVHPGPYSSAKVGDGVALTKGQSVADWARAKSLVRREEEGLSLAKFIKGFALGDWKDAEAEKKGLMESVAAQGGVLVPTPLSLSLVDLLRNQARVFQAGATTVPMTSSTQKIARQTSDPTGVWHAESAADLAVSAPSFDAVTLTARTLVCIVKLSLEVLEDAIVAGGAGQVVENAIAKALALQLDSAALYGAGGTAPTGVKNQAGVTITPLATNGATPTSYDFLTTAIFAQALQNVETDGIIDSPRTEQTLALLKDTMNNPLRAPDAVNAVPRYPTNQVPTNLPVGTSGNVTSDAFVADWDQLLIGMRTDLQLRLLNERYLGDTGEIGVFAHLRADVQLAHPQSFSVLTGIKP